MLMLGSGFSCRATVKLGTLCAFISTHKIDFCLNSGAMV